MVRGMAQEIAEHLLPAIHSEIDDVIASRSIGVIQQAINRARRDYIGSLFEQQSERLARNTLSMAESATTQQFMQSVNSAVGVDLSRILSSTNLQGYIDAGVAENVNLIRSLSSDYFGDIEQIVMDGVRQGQSMRLIERNLIDRTGASESRAKLIARDQVAKASSDINRRRMQQVGVTRFRWLTARDQRVSGNPAGRYPNAKIKCYQIAQRDIGMGPGVYLVDRGASYAGEDGLFPGRAHINCRCSPRALIPGIDYNP